MMKSNEVIENILELKKTLEHRVIIPAHHYVSPEIVGVSDVVGDSYKLAVDCSRSKAEFIVFCGVYFMAEAADVLGQEGQKVMMPALDALCPMADQIGSLEAQRVYKEIARHTSADVVPVVYMNSSAEVKDFCGARGGAVCTSSNAGMIVRHFLDLGRPVFFAPDHNLGINTARTLGLKEDDIVRVSRDFMLRGEAARAKLFLWEGSCHVHKRFAVSDLELLRNKHPGIRIIVHPECDEDVVAASDDCGSTAKIYDSIRNSPAGSIWGVGTESHFVERIASEFPEKTILSLRKSVCCNMARNTPEKLWKSLQSIQAHLDSGSPLTGLVKVSEETKAGASKALKKMIGIVEGAK